jgi:hypothetical protein
MMTLVISTKINLKVGDDPVNLPRYCGQSEKLLQKSKEDKDVIKEIIYKGV